MSIAAFMDEALLESLGLEALVPDTLAHWRPLVVEGMLFFLGRLPPERLMAILADQLELPEDSSPARRLVALLAHCPTLHKLGQVLARHQALPSELRRHLQSLESMPPSTPMAAILARIREETGGDPRIDIAPGALAEGSVAVVVPFGYCEDGELKHGVFKVLRPGVEARLTEELAILDEVAAFLEERGWEMDLPSLDYRNNLKSVQRLLTREIRLETEQDNLRAALEFYAGETRILVPRLLPWCTPRLTAMERVFGTKVTDAPLSPERRRELADTMVSTLLAQPFWARNGGAAFHADLHAGNLLVTEDGRLAALDWSLTASLAKTHKEALVAIALGGLTLDRARICQAFASLGSLEADDPGLIAVVERSLDRLVLRGRLPGFAWLLAMLDEIALLGATGFREDFALFRKSWLSLAGVIGDLAGERSPDFPLLAVGMSRFLEEIPSRLMAPLYSPDFATHVSNADILQLGASTWLTGLRYWTRLAAGALRA